MKNLFYFIVILMSLSACCKDHSAIPPCYDASIVHNNPCTMDCPGVTGCDGKFYCNECEAARHGIRVKKK